MVINEFSKKMKYEVIGSFCITLCPHTNIGVGSWFCVNECKWFNKNDAENKIIYCSCGIDGVDNENY